MGWWRICLTLIRLACAAKANPAATKPKIKNTSTQKISLPVLISLFLCFSLWPSSPRIWHPSNRKIAQALHSRTPACLLAYWKIRQIRRLRQQSFGTQLNKSSLLSVPSVLWSIPLVEPAGFFKGCSCCCCDGVLGNAKGGAWTRAREREPPQQ
jgi:hypothetical protein